MSYSQRFSSRYVLGGNFFCVINADDVITALVKTDMYDLTV
jgi:hypothetical protein